jgi:hypothetical protein
MKTFESFGFQLHNKVFKNKEGFGSDLLGTDILRGDFSDLTLRLILTALIHRSRSWTANVAANKKSLWIEV